MAPRKPKATEPAATSPVNSARVIKTRSSSAASAVKDPSVPATPSHRVKRYRDRMLNLEQTPEHLVDVAKRNATDSPLLRLPPEIRNRIWSFAMGGQLVTLPNYPGQKGFAIEVNLKPGLDASGIVPYVSDYFSNNFNIKRLLASFHLPEVCRQIYSEAALTAYQQNIFMFESTFEWFNRLRSVQRRAIESVEIGAGRLYATMKNSQVVPMTNKLPNLRYILVSAPALRHAQYWYAISGGSQNSTDKDWHGAVMRRLREVNGDNIKIEFEK